MGNLAGSNAIALKQQADSPLEECGVAYTFAINSSA